MEIVDVVGERGGGRTRRTRRRDAAAVGEDDGDGERTGPPSSGPYARAKETTMEELLDVLARRGEAGGRVIDEGGGDGFHWLRF